MKDRGRVASHQTNERTNITYSVLEQPSTGKARYLEQKPSPWQRSVAAAFSTGWDHDGPQLGPTQTSGLTTKLTMRSSPCAANAWPILASISS